MVKEPEGQIINGRGGMFLKLLKELQPGVLITLVSVGVGVLFNINSKQNAQGISTALLQRDVQALTMRVNAEDANNVNSDVHQEQIEDLATEPDYVAAYQALGIQIED